MFKNKIYNYITLELLKSFILVLFSLSLIAWTVRAVNFLDLIVDSGYSTSTYFIYSILNLTIIGINCQDIYCLKPCFDSLACGGDCPICRGPIPWSRCVSHWNKNGTKGIENEVEV